MAMKYSKVVILGIVAGMIAVPALVVTGRVRAANPPVVGKVSGLVVEDPAIVALKDRVKALEKALEKALANAEAQSNTLRDRVKIVEMKLTVVEANTNDGAKSMSKLWKDYEKHTHPFVATEVGLHVMEINGQSVQLAIMPSKELFMTRPPRNSLDY